MADTGPTAAQLPEKKKDEHSTGGSDAGVTGDSADAGPTGHAHLTAVDIPQLASAQSSAVLSTHDPALGAEASIRTHQRMACEALTRGDLDATETHLDKAKELLDYFGTDNPALYPERLELFALTLNNYACLFMRQGRFSAARVYLERARQTEARLCHMRDGVRVANAAETLTNLASVLSKLHHHEEALPIVLDAIDVLSAMPAGSQPRNPISLAIAYHNLGVEYEFLGDFDRALEAFAFALRISDINLGSADPVTARIKQVYSQALAMKAHRARRRRRSPTKRAGAGKSPPRTSRSRGSLHSSPQKSTARGLSSSRSHRARLSDSPPVPPSSPLPLGRPHTRDGGMSSSHRSMPDVLRPHTSPPRSSVPRASDSSLPPMSPMSASTSSTKPPALQVGTAPARSTIRTPTFASPLSWHAEVQRALDEEDRGKFATKQKLPPPVSKSKAVKKKQHLMRRAFHSGFSQSRPCLPLTSPGAADRVFVKPKPTGMPPLAVTPTSRSTTSRERQFM